MVVAQDGVERGAVRLGPPVVAQKVTILADSASSARGHHGHVVESHALHVLLGHFVPGSRRRVMPRAPSGGAIYPALSATPAGAALG